MTLEEVHSQHNSEKSTVWVCKDHVFFVTYFRTQWRSSFVIQWNFLYQDKKIGYVFDILLNDYLNASNWLIVIEFVLSIKVKDYCYDKQWKNTKINILGILRIELCSNQAESVNKAESWKFHEKFMKVKFPFNSIQNLYQRVKTKSTKICWSSFGDTVSVWIRCKPLMLVISMISHEFFVLKLGKIISCYNSHNKFNKLFVHSTFITRHWQCFFINYRLFVILIFN